MSLLLAQEIDVITLKRERLVSALFWCVVSGFFFFDIFDDWYEGIPFYHIIVEVLLGLFGLGMALYLFTQYARVRGTLLKKAREELVESKRLALEWQKQAKVFREGLTTAITAQLEKWEMTEAEKE